MTTTLIPVAIDLTKGTDVPESTSRLLNDPHVPSFEAVRTVECETSMVLVNQSNLIRIVSTKYVVTVWRDPAPANRRQIALWAMWHLAQIRLTAPSGRT